MYLKSDQKKHQKIPTYGAAPYLYITLLVLNLTGWVLHQSVLESGLLTGGFKDLFYLIGFLFNARCSENSVAQRGEVVY